MSYVPISDAALGAVGSSRAGRYAVLDLYERSFRSGYGWLTWTERDLGEAWEVDRRVVRSIVGALEVAGCIEVERSEPGSRQPSRLRVLPPVRRRGVEPEAEPDTDRSGNQTRNQPGQRQAQRERVIGEPDAEPEGGTRHGEDLEPSRAESFARAVVEREEIKEREEVEQQTDVASDEPTRSSSAGQAPGRAERSAHFGAFLAAWDAEVVPAVRKRGGTVAEHGRLDPGRGLGRKLRQRIDQHGLDDCLLVARWYATSDDDRARFLREGGHELDTLIRPEKFDGYLARAKSAASQPLKLVGKHAHDRAPPRAEPPPETPEARAKRVAEEEEAIRQWEAEIAAREAAKQQQRRRT